MSVRAIEDRTFLLNITNMNNCEDDNAEVIGRSGDNGAPLAKGVQAVSTPPAASPIVLNSAIAAPPHENVVNCSCRPGTIAARKDSSRSSLGCSGRFVRGSGSQNSKDRMDESGDHAAKKRKTRRGKPKHRKLKPYSKQSYEGRLRSRAIGRMLKTGGQPPAPYNTTQFLMEDHSDLPDLDQKLAVAVTSEVPVSFQKPLAPPRTRDSSFSIDSDEDYFYSSPENEEEFLTKEFSSAYEDLHAERLSALTKSELIQEYVQLEAKLDILTKRLRGKSIQQLEDRDAEVKKCASSDAEMAKKLKICQQRMEDLIQQNEQLRRDNEALREKNCHSPVSSVDSESDSSDSNEDHSSCSCSAPSTESPTATGASFQARREKEQRRNKRLSSIDSENDSDDCTSSDDSSAIPRANQSPKTTEATNGNASSHEIRGHPT